MDCQRPALLLFVFLLIAAMPMAMAGDPTEKPETDKFVDLDGDGIRDNAADTDNDGIPDFDSKSDESDSPELAGLISFGDAGKSVDAKSIMTSREKFKLRKFSCRAHTSNCGEFGSGDFGPAQGISGAVSGACAGGICY